MTGVILSKQNLLDFGKSTIKKPNDPYKLYLDALNDELKSPNFRDPKTDSSVSSSSTCIDRLQYIPYIEKDKSIYESNIGMTTMSINGIMDSTHRIYLRPIQKQDDILNNTNTTNQATEIDNHDQTRSSLYYDPYPNNFYHNDNNEGYVYKPYSRQAFLNEIYKNNELNKLKKKEKINKTSSNNLLSSNKFTKNELDDDIYNLLDIGLEPLERIIYDLKSLEKPKKYIYHNINKTNLKYYNNNNNKNNKKNKLQSAFSKDFSFLSYCDYLQNKTSKTFLELLLDDTNNLNSNKFNDILSKFNLNEDERKKALKEIESINNITYYNKHNNKYTNDNNKNDNNNNNRIVNRRIVSKLNKFSKSLKNNKDIIKEHLNTSLESIDPYRYQNIIKELSKNDNDNNEKNLNQETFKRPFTTTLANYSKERKNISLKSTIINNSSRSSSTLSSKSISTSSINNNKKDISKRPLSASAKFSSTSTISSKNINEKLTSKKLNSSSFILNKENNNTSNQLKKTIEEIKLDKIKKIQIINKNPTEYFLNKYKNLKNL